MKNIVLIGFMGTGKTSVGKVLAQKLHRTMVDVDQEIEKEFGRRISDIFEKDGEAAFRVMEKKTVSTLSKRSDLVITTGGGVVLDPENLSALKQNGIILAFFAKPHTVYDRVRNSQNRPLLKVPDVLAEIEKLSAFRAPLYREAADYTFETDGKRPAEMADLILKKMEGKLH